MKSNELPSVTQVLGVLRKTQLEMWFKLNTAQFCDEESKRSKEIGTLVHKVIQDHIEQKEIKFETEYPEEVTNCLKGFFLFKKEHSEIVLKRSEIEVISKEHGFIGHIDCLAEKNKILCMGDWKTSTCDVGKFDKNGKSKEKDKPTIYPEHEYQISAYVSAYNEQMKENITDAFILCLAKDKIAYNLKRLNESEIKDRFEKIFLPCLSIYNFQLTHK